MAAQRAARVLKHPGAFVVQTLKAFRANHRFLLAGAVAYYSLLSIVPLLMLAVITLSHFVDPTVLLQTPTRYLECLLPGESKAMVDELAALVEHRDVMRWVSLVTMLF